MIVDILDRLKQDLDALDEEIDNIDEDLYKYDENDPWEQDNIRQLRELKSRYRRDKITLLRQYHNINQDLSLRNKEIEIRIKKMEAEISFLGETEDAISKGDRILNYIDRIAHQEVLGDGEERLPEYYERGDL